MTRAFLFYVSHSIVVNLYDGAISDKYRIVICVVDKESGQGRGTTDFPEVEKSEDELHRTAQCTGIQFGLYSTENLR